VIVVAGATGTLGPILVPHLLAGGEPVRVISRDRAAAAARLPGVDIVAGDVTRAQEARRAVDGARVVVSAITGFGSPAGTRAVDVEGNRTLARTAADAGAEHYVLLSVHHAGPDEPMELFRAKFAAEAAVREAGVPATVIRPTAYLELWFRLLGGPLLEAGRTTVFGRGRNPINFVSAVDVARAVTLAVRDTAMRGRVIEMPGPENLTMDQLVGIVRTTTGVAGRVAHTPLPSMRLLSVLLRPVRPVIARQIAAAVTMDTRDMAVDGPSIRAATPSIPMTTAADVAARMFASGAEAATASSPA